jgi:hypothetical protein
MIFAGIIANPLGMSLVQQICNAVGQVMLSYKKLYDLLAGRLIKARD